ncbi:hypothetical protein BGW80DRAFT_1321426 [Lactifluus volemus]|nr:hypothetical protein BGW80DRAFT_1321426 [Lactifluus volemus]
MDITSLQWHTVSTEPPTSTASSQPQHLRANPPPSGRCHCRPDTPAYSPRYHRLL